MSHSLLLIHGMCCTGEVWANFKTFYQARGHRVFTPTLRPLERVRKRPPPSFATLRFQDYVDDVAREIDRIEVETGEPPILIGHSMGGLIAQVLAATNRPKAAVFISPTAPADVRDRQQRMFWGALRIARDLGVTPRTVFPYRRVADALVFNCVPASARDAEHAGMVQEPRAIVEDIAQQLVDETKIRIPVLTVAARRDRLVPAPIVRLTAKKYAPVGGAFKEYANHGHWLYSEPGWETPAAEILAWAEANA